MTPNNEQDRLDPDLFEALVTAMNTIASVGSFAIAWKQIRANRGSQRQDLDTFQIKTQITAIEEQFAAVFRCLREVTALFKSVEVRESKLLSDHKIGFGRATYQFTSSEFQYFQNQMLRLNNAFASVSASSNVLIQTFGYGRVSGEDAIKDNLEGIHEELNSFLFSSPTFDEAILKIDALKDRVHAFLRQLENLGNGPS